MKYEAVLFDMDGVIVDTMHYHTRAFIAAMRNLGYPITEQDYKLYFGTTDAEGARRHFAHLGVAGDVDVFLDEKFRIYRQIVSTTVPAPYPGVLELISNLTLRRTPLALVTGSIRSEAMNVLEGLGITAHFSAVVSANDVTQGKPHPEGYLKGATLLRVDPAQCVVIEDSLNGIRAANAAGMHSVAVTNTHAGSELGEATYVVEQLSADIFDHLINKPGI